MSDTNKVNSIKNLLKPEAITQLKKLREDMKSVNDAFSLIDGILPVDEKIKKQIQATNDLVNRLDID